ncbi:MAG: response regulator [Minisyncoccia bacterium]
MKKILIIDDNNTFQKTISDKLKSSGYETISAFDGLEGLDIAKGEKPDLILLDIKMPTMDGMTFLHKLREDTGSKEVPVFITSNMSTITNIGEGVSLGVKGYIIKSDETLDTIVKEVNNFFDSNDKK